LRPLQPALSAANRSPANTNRIGAVKISQIRSRRVSLAQTIPSRSSPTTQGVRRSPLSKLSRTQRIARTTYLISTIRGVPLLSLYPAALECIRKG
jgi:hypothetical protein